MKLLLWLVVLLAPLPAECLPLLPRHLLLPRPLLLHLGEELSLRMARNERLNQQATSNRALMDSFGK
ncbi:hypothetical protein JOQ06_026054 [Pogonophryne albipinna]|uniref:Corticotropin-releasing factor domain-containing protein n=1 Tax=Pogonophryne albipinna TaxID=1090488 RepID=A0AAD6A4V5_9TELE|nr:hypothetical protein JOQ06_026054 [Pogonophryne albipinna]